MNPVERILKYSDPAQMDISQEYLDRAHDKIMNALERRQILPLVPPQPRYPQRPAPVGYSAKIKSWLEEKISPPKTRPNSTLMAFLLTLLSLSAFSNQKPSISNLEANLRANLPGELSEKN